MTDSELTNWDDEAGVGHFGRIVALAAHDPHDGGAYLTGVIERPDKVWADLMAADLRAADIRDPDLDDQHLTPARALRGLGRIRAVELEAGDRRIMLVTRRSALQSRALDAFGVDASGWSRARIA